MCGGGGRQETPGERDRRRERETYKRHVLFSSDTVCLFHANCEVVKKEYQMLCTTFGDIPYCAASSDAVRGFLVSYARYIAIPHLGVSLSGLSLFFSFSLPLSLPSLSPLSFSLSPFRSLSLSF